MSREGRRIKGTNEAVERMSAQDPKTPPQPKAPERDNMRRDAEIESIKRTLYNAIDKLDKIQRRKAELITT